MDRGRLEAFSDAVIAIVMTIMVLDLRPPEATEWSALSSLVPVFLAYLLSFVYLGIYWNNHHHLLKAGTGVSAGIMWSNLALLFGLTLFPFATAWVGGGSHLARAPTILYGVVLLYAAIAYYVLQGRIVARAGGSGSEVARALGRDWKGRLSPALYLLAIVFAFVDTRLSAALYVAVALLWLVPDRRLAPTAPE